jgi:hypothetical protein
MEMSDQLQSLGLLNPQYPVDRSLSGLLSQSGCGGKEKKSQSQPVVEPGCPAHSLVTVLTELPQIRCNIIKEWNVKWTLLKNILAYRC